MNWRGDPNLSHMSDDDYLRQLIQHLTDLAHANPDDARTLFLRGNAYLDRGDPENAIADYSRVLELTPGDAVALNNRGIALRQSGDADAAIRDYARAIEIDPEYRDAHNNMGIALSDKGEYERAITCYTEAIRIDPAYWYAYNDRGLALWAVGRRDEARQDYEAGEEVAGRLDEPRPPMRHPNPMRRRLAATHA